MKGPLLLTVCLLRFVSAFWDFWGQPKATTSSSRLEVHPEFQVLNEHESVVIDCWDRQGGEVYWTRSNGFSLPKQARQTGGRLYIEKMELADGGIYICYIPKENLRKAAYVEVIPRGSFFTTHQWPTSTWRSTEKPFPVTIIPKTTVNVPYPCLYGICNGTCCESNSNDLLFDCANGQKINRSLVCNRVNDCEDGSDESRCASWPPKITVLPKNKVEVYCGGQDEDKVGTLILECESVGHPMPVIRWKKYDGHVPSKCQQFSKRGHGVLTCPNFQQSDQGAYSCVAENSVKLAESQPKSLAKCSNTIHCHNGFKVVNEEQIEHCIECYCSGKTTSCQNIKSGGTVIKMPFPGNPTEIFAKDDGEIVFLPTRTQITPNSSVRNSTYEITYCSLSESDFSETSFVKSFGRSIIFPRYKGKTNFMENAPDLIIRGNGLSLMYKAKLLLPRKGSVMDMSVKFWPGNWHHLNKAAASRKDLMKVLSNVDSLFIRCEYEQGNTLSLDKNATITIESSTIKGFANSISYVEKCDCPTGYDGLSCETCAAGYERKSGGNYFTCEKIYVPPPIKCEEGYINPNCSQCDTSKGYYRRGNVCLKPTCHPSGSTALFPDNSKKCTCRERVTGDSCDRCENGSFYLHKARGCLKCWCSGVTNQCSSSNLYRTVISNTPRGGYNSSDGRNFWLLPSDFSGNRLTSYGGHLNYTMKYKPLIPKGSTLLTVEFLSMDDITLIYTHSTVDSSSLKEEKSWSVPLTEIDWKKSDRSSVTRDEFLEVLSKVKAIYIESPYHLSSGLANLTSTRMSSASSTRDGDNELALAVEKCNCPIGYTGLSCEKCSDGYYKKRNGTITQCIKCNCTYCDPDFGCMGCPQLEYRDNPEEEKIPVCKPCPCNGNGVSCVKDDHNQIFCRCKPGFTGMHCENPIKKERSDFTITISPRKIKGKKADTSVSVNCSVVSSEEMTLTVKKTFLNNIRNDTKILLTQGSNISERFEVALEVDMETVECLVHDSKGRVAGHVVSFVEDLITVIKPVKITNCHSDTIDIKESESKDIICQATGFPAPMINWYRMAKGSESEKVDTSEGVHTIESASLNENGTIYTCIAENSEADKDSCTQVLIVRKKCEVVNIIPKHVKATEGDDISILCKTTAKSPVYWWTQDPFFGREKEIKSPRIEKHNGYLNIKNSTVWDSGTYICTATGESGIINQTVLVEVQEKRIPPSVSIQEFDKTLKAGENFTVNCIVTGKPVPHVTWKKFNGVLDSNVFATGKILQIKKATLSNSGIYECEAVSISGVASGFISIDVEQVLVPPRINISETEIKAHVGDTVHLSCLGIGFPRPKLSWFAPNLNFTTISRKTDEMILIEPNESIEEKVSFKITKDMDGLTVTCFADNSDGRDEKACTIKVLQPKGGINETIEFVPIGSYFEIQCDFPGELRWEREGGSLVGDECPIPNALMIKAVQVQHNGTYICRDNSDSEKRINLIVVGFVPKFSKDSGSYLVLPIKSYSRSEIRIELTFNATHANGMLLQEENKTLDIYLHDRKIHLKIYSIGEDSLDIHMNQPIKLWRWYSLVVSINKNYVDITIYDEVTSIHDRKTEYPKDFNISVGLIGESFFVGGPAMKSRHSHRSFKRYPYFDGCISRLSINRHEYDIVKESSHSQNVSLCRMCFEAQNPCDTGKCLDAPTQRGFICVCPGDNDICSPSCSGRGCETSLDLCALLNPCNGFINKCINKVNSLQCECAYGYTGNTCERVQEYSFCAKGNGYVKLPSTILRRQIGIAEEIRMAFTLHTLSGQLLWQGDRANHLSIAVRDGILEYIYLNQYTKLQIHKANKLSLNKKYSILIRRTNSTVIMELNGSTDKGPEVYRNATSKYYTNRVNGDIYLGNVPNNTRHIGHHVGLTGCIHYISFGEKAKINFPEKAIEKFNVFLPQKLYYNYGSDESDYDGNSDSNEILRS